MSVIKEAHTVTKQLFNHLNEPFPKDEGREEYIEQIQTYLEKRGELFDKITRPSSKEDEKILKEMVDMNETINQRLTSMQGLIRLDINKLKKRKQTGKKYENPYDGPTTDGVFFDSKK